MKGILIAFGLVAAIDYVADGEMDMTQHVATETGQAFMNTVDGVIDGTGYVLRRIGYEIGESAPRP